MWVKGKWTRDQTGGENWMNHDESGRSFSSKADGDNSDRNHSICGQGRFWCTNMVAVPDRLFLVTPTSVGKESEVCDMTIPHFNPFVVMVIVDNCSYTHLSMKQSVVSTVQSMCVCVSVSVSGTGWPLQTRLNWSRCHLGGVTQVDQRNLVLDGVEITYRKGNFGGCMTHWKALLGVSFKLHAAKWIIKSSITAWRRDCCSWLQCSWLIDVTLRCPRSYLCQRSRRNCNGVTPNGGAKYKWDRFQSAIFDLYLSIIFHLFVEKPPLKRCTWKFV